MHNGFDERRPVGAASAGRNPPLTTSGGTRVAHWKGRVALASAIAAVAALSACGGSSNPFPTPSATPPTGSPSLSPSTLDLKPVLRGLLDRNGAPPSTYLGALAGYVVNVHWSQLQPSSGVSIAANNPIDEAIKQVRELNATDHTHLGLKLRIFARHLGAGLGQDRSVGALSR